MAEGRVLSFSAMQGPRCDTADAIDCPDGERTPEALTFPAQEYAVNGERRSFALLRPIVDRTAQGRVRDLILDAYAEYEERLVS